MPVGPCLHIQTAEEQSSRFDPLRRLARCGACYRYDELGEIFLGACLVPVWQRRTLNFLAASLHGDSIYYPVSASLTRIKGENARRVVGQPGFRSWFITLERLHTWGYVAEMIHV